MRFQSRAVIIMKCLGFLSAGEPVDCIDLMSDKALIIAECAKRGQRVIKMGSAGSRRNCATDRGRE